MTTPTTVSKKTNSPKLLRLPCFIGIFAGFGGDVNSIEDLRKKIKEIPDRDDRIQSIKRIKSNVDYIRSTELPNSKQYFVEHIKTEEDMKANLNLLDDITKMLKEEFDNLPNREIYFTFDESEVFELEGGVSLSVRGRNSVNRDDIQFTFNNVSKYNNVNHRTVLSFVYNRKRSSEISKILIGMKDNQKIHPGVHWCLADYEESCQFSINTCNNPGKIFNIFRNYSHSKWQSTLCCNIII